MFLFVSFEEMCSGIFGGIVFFAILFLIWAFLFGGYGDYAALMTLSIASIYFFIRNVFLIFQKISDIRYDMKKNKNMKKELMKEIKKSGLGLIFLILLLIYRNNISILCYTYAYKNK